MATQNSEAVQKHREAVSAELYEWILTARTLVDAHFPRESAAAHSAMVLDAARTLMLADRLGAVGASLRQLNRTLDSKTGS